MTTLVAVLVLAAPQEPPPRERAAEALRKAVAFFRSEVAVQGGYLWRCSEDLSKREGEERATDTMAWVQPPGTPTIGLAYLAAHEATGEAVYLEAARETAQALVRGQLRSGGWDYRIEFNPKLRTRWAYRTDPKRSKARNTSTLDDNTTQSALTLLMRTDRALGFKDRAIHEAAAYALEALLKAQYPNGSWPQRFDGPPDPARHPVRKASFPESWPRKHPNVKYSGFYTFNDNAQADVIRTFFEAAEIYEKDEYLEAAKKGGDFILLAQMPEPQPGWAQQYDADMHPAWARRFEPPSVTGGEAQGVMRTLLFLYRKTADRKYLEPLPRAIAYYRRSLLPDGRLARFYELKTNRPLYFTRDYKLTYSDADVPTHYAFKVSSKIDRIAREYEELKKEKLPLPATEKGPQMTKDLERRAMRIVEALDDRGRWVEKGSLKKQEYSGGILDSNTFASNVTLLSRYLAASKR